MPRKKLIEPQLLPYLQSEITVAESARALDADFLQQHACYVRIIGRVRFGSKQFQWCAFALLVAHFNGLLPARVRRAVQFTEITKRALPRAIRRAHRFDQRPVAVLLAVFVDAEPPKEYARNLPLSR